MGCNRELVRSATALAACNEEPIRGKSAQASEEDPLRGKTIETLRAEIRTTAGDCGAPFGGESANMMRTLRARERPPRCNKHNTARRRTRAKA